MATILNADTISGGFIATGDSSGILQLQSSGTPSLTLNTSGAHGVGSSPSYGTSGQVLQSNGSSAAPSWVTPSSGAMTLISTQTANGSSQSIQWTGLSTYSKYLLILNNIQLGGNSYIEIQFGYGSSPTWYTSGYTAQIVYSTSNAVATFGGSGAGGIQLNGNNIKGTTAPGMYATASIQIGDGSSIYPSATSQSGYLNYAATAAETTNSSGYQTTVSNQVNAIRIFSGQF